MEVIQEGVLVDASGADDPDLNQAFWDFRNAIEQEANAGGSIAVYEVPTDMNGNARPSTYQQTKLFTVPVGSSTLDDICDRVLREFVEPGGKILVRLMARKDGERGIKMNKLVSLKRAKESAQPQGASAEIAQLMRVMNEQRAQDRADMQRMLEQVAGARGPAVDPMQQAMALTATITNLATGIVSKAAPAPTAPAESMVQSMTAMLGLMKMMREFSGEGAKKEDPGASGILENIRALAAPLLAAKATQEERALINEKRMLIHERQGATGTSATPAAPSARDGAPTDANGTAQTPTEETLKAGRAREEAKMKLLAVLKEGLPMIVSLAKGPKPADPAETAKLVLKNLPEDEQALNDAFYALVQDPPAEFLGQLAVVCPEVKEHAEWFEAFRQALLVEFDPDKLTPA